MLIVGVTGRTEVLEDCVISVVRENSGLPGVSVLTMISVDINSGVTEDSVLIEVSVVDEDSVLL